MHGLPPKPFWVTVTGMELIPREPRRWIGELQDTPIGLPLPATQPRRPCRR